MLDDSQTQTGAAGPVQAAAGRISLEKTLEDTVLYLRRNPTAGVGHSEQDTVMVGLQIASDRTAGVELFFTEPVSGSMSYDSRFLALFDVILSWK